MAPGGGWAVWILFLHGEFIGVVNVWEAPDAGPGCVVAVPSRSIGVVNFWGQLMQARTMWLLFLVSLSALSDLLLKQKFSYL